MNAEYPLLRHAPDAPFAQTADGRTVTADEFLAEARTLAARLPATRHVINLCEDRYRFALGFVAAILRGQISVLPPDRTPGAIRQVATACLDCCLLADYDRTDDTLPVVRLPAALPRLPGPRPLIRSDQTVAVLFTSGSTGLPAANPKTWGMLASGAHMLAERLGLGDGGAVLGTVPPQHMFGLETTIMLPLQRGGCIHAGQPLLPEDIRQALLALPAPRWLMTTPLHLKACMAEDDLDVPPLAGVIASTMPLAETLARTVEARWDAPLHEIYGCTEAGMMALRRPAREAHWHWVDDVQVTPAADGRFVAAGTRIAGTLPLIDRIEPLPDSAFTLRGRLGNILKIAGKRTSIEALNTALETAPGVVDGIFFQPEPDLDNHGRLMAFVVAPGQSPATVIAALRQSVDPVFLPRPLLLVDALPRTGAGKPARAALLELARRHLDAAHGTHHD